MRARFDDWILDSDRRELRCRGEKVHLTPKAFRLLDLLIEHRPKALSKKELTDLVWPSTNVADGSLTTLVKELRLALGDRARDSRFVRTVFGYGYAFAMEAAIEDVSSVIDSVAVLPFENLGGGADLQYLSDGLAEELINILGRMPHLRVAPCSSSFRYRSHSDIRAVARDLRVRAIVTGRVSRHDKQLIVQAELVDGGADARLLWGNRFHHRADDLQHLQSDIATEISVHLCARLTTGEVRRIVSTAPANTAAWDLYLRGRHYCNRRDAEGFRRAIENFKAATELDPSFARAHSALAEAYVALGTRDTAPPRQVFPLARQAAEQAIAIDPSLGAAHAVLGVTSELFDWDWPGAEAHHIRAAALESHDATAAHWFALHLARRGRHTEAEIWMAQALGREPLSAIIATNAALLAYLRRDLDAALALSGAALDLHPFYEGALLIRGVCLTQVDLPSAIAVLETAIRLSGRQPHLLANLAFACGASGRSDEARQLRREIASSTGHVSHANLALIDISLDNLDTASHELCLAAEDRSPWLSYLMTELRLDRLRARNDFQRLLHTIGLV